MTPCVHRLEHHRPPADWEEGNERGGGGRGARFATEGGHGWEKEHCGVVSHSVETKVWECLTAEERT